jgi:hypothetical protein
MKSKPFRYAVDPKSRELSWRWKLLGYICAEKWQPSAEDIADTLALQFTLLPHGRPPDEIEKYVIDLIRRSVPRRKQGRPLKQVSIRDYLNLRDAAWEAEKLQRKRQLAQKAGKTRGIEPYNSANREIGRLHGIGQKTLEKLRKRFAPTGE